MAKIISFDYNNGANLSTQEFVALTQTKNNDQMINSQFACVKVPNTSTLEKNVVNSPFACLKSSGSSLLEKNVVNSQFACVKLGDTYLLEQNICE